MCNAREGSTSAYIERAKNILPHHQINMKHIKDIIAEKQMSLFAKRAEKGSREWSAFNAVHGDTIGMFRVATPRKAETPRYPNIIHINRYPRRLTLKVAR